MSSNSQVKGTKESGGVIVVVVFDGDVGVDVEVGAVVSVSAATVVRVMAASAATTKSNVRRCGMAQAYCS